MLLNNHRQFILQFQKIAMRDKGKSHKTHGKIITDKSVCFFCNCQWRQKNIRFSIILLQIQI